MDKISTIIMGGGPAGLTAAAELCEQSNAVTICEKDPLYVGGLARTVHYKGFRFDIGGHRFFSKSPEITQWWKDRLPDDFISVKRLSRIFYQKKFFDYPLRASNALFNLGIGTSFLCLLSYIHSRLFPIQPEKSFADWVTNRFGQRLFRIFFKTYTEKVWGMPCDQISADWAAQRIKGLSLTRAVLNALFPPRKEGKEVVKTLIDSFQYPRLGPGMMWEKTRDDLIRQGAQIRMGEEVVSIQHQQGRVMSVLTCGPAGQKHEYFADAFISSIPLRECIQAFTPALPSEIRETASRLQYRDFLTVALMIDCPAPFSDNWIYVHDPAVKLGRIQNFNNWSAAMVPRLNTTCLGLEYFCFAGDRLWNLPDLELIELGKTELRQLGLIHPNLVSDGCVVRMEKAYPVYYPGYLDDIALIRSAISKFENFQVIGRNGCINTIIKTIP
jgi:protoporphyrinogen oxidase